jgi:hypothetical protein
LNRFGLVLGWLSGFTLLAVGCTDLPAGTRAAVESYACVDRDGDSFGEGCVNGSDCDDSNARITRQCRTCTGRSEEGCPCAEAAVESCFLPDTQLPDNRVMCSEGTRTCRHGGWSSCENAHQYVARVTPDTQQLIDADAGTPTCSICDVLCFKAIDNLLSDSGTADGSVAFANGGGVTLVPIDASSADAAVLSDCSILDGCCSTLAGSAASACMATANAGVDATCRSALATYCPTTPITGPLTGCTPGSGPDSDCDGIPNAVDTSVGAPFSSTNNQTIFHQLGVGGSASNSIDIAYKMSNADVYVLFDATGTMGPVRQNLENLLTTGNFADCAQLSQCCGSDTTCQAIASANNATNCHSSQLSYCGGYVDCADVDLNGTPNNELKTQGIVGGIRCVVGTAWFGLGQFREIPVHSEPEPDFCLGENCRYGDRDEQIFRNLVDMTPDHERVRTALSKITMNYNWDEPEGGWLALNSVVTGNGHYFGMNRPALADRRAAQGCAAGSFGYPCFRKDAIPIVVMFTDAPHHNGPASSALDPNDCYHRGAGCPYPNLTSTNTWTTSSMDSASDKTAHFVPASAERATSALDLGDLKAAYVTAVGDTTYMRADYPQSVVGCNAADDAPDALLRFSIGDNGGSQIKINFHLTKNDAYSGALYGRWSPQFGVTPGTDDPTPATEFGAVVSVFEGTPDDLGGAGSLLKCFKDAQPSPLSGSNWDTQSADFDVKLDDNKTYYVSVKGYRTSDRGQFQLQIGNVNARINSTYTAPLWSETQAALIAAGVRVLPVLATGGYSNNFVAAAEAQAQLVAQATKAVRADGSPIWHRIQNTGTETGQAIVTSIAELAKHLSMKVSLVALDGPDPGASLFKISVTPQNSPGCLSPHPLLAGDGTCSGSGPTYNCNTQYNCRPGASPRYRVTFTNPLSAPVPPNASNPYGGYLFKLQLKGDDKYLLSEIPVFIIPTTQMQPPPPVFYQPSGVYEQPVAAAACKRHTATADGGSKVDLDSSFLPNWSDLYFDADVPQDTSIDFELCTAATASDLDGCVWNADGGTHKKMTVASHNACTTDSQCLNVAGYGNGLCKSGSCRFVSLPKIFSDMKCTTSAECPNRPLGSGDYIIRSRCETSSGAYGYGRCVALDEPLDMGSTLFALEDGKPFSKVRVTMHANTLMTRSPTLYDWYLTYTCHAAL